VTTALPDTDLGTAACTAVPHLFEDIELRQGPRIAAAAAHCAVCPIAAPCRTYGTRVKGTGVYGGIYLIGGLAATPGAQHCAATGCTTPPHGYGLCRLHYRRWQSTGDPDWKPATHCGCGRSIQPGRTGLCKRCYQHRRDKTRTTR